MGTHSSVGVARHNLEFAVGYHKDCRLKRITKINNTIDNMQADFKVSAREFDQTLCNV